MSPSDVDFDRIVRSPWVAGALGAVVALRGAPGQTWGSRAFNVFCGLLIAGNLTPAVAEAFSLATPAQHSAAAFMLGLFGMNLTAAIVALIQETKLSDVLPWLRGRGDRP